MAKCELCEKADDLMGVGNPPKKWYCEDHYNEGIHQAFVPVNLMMAAFQKHCVRAPDDEEKQ